MDKQDLMLGVLIASFFKPGLLSPTGCKDQIMAGVKVSREILSLYASTAETEDRALFEEAIADLKIITSSSSYQDLASWTVTSGKTGILRAVEMASADYTQARFRLVINDKEIWTDKELPESLALSLPDITIGGGKTVRIQGKSADGSAFKMWGDITGKEVM